MLVDYGLRFIRAGEMWAAFTLLAGDVNRRVDASRQPHLERWKILPNPGRQLKARSCANRSNIEEIYIDR